MVSQVICVVCSVLPEPHTTEITFYKFPKATDVPVMFKAWKKAIVDALASERPGLLNDSSLNDTYVCSQHFTAADFSFENGKLILLKNAIPTRVKKDLYEIDYLNQSNRNTKDYEPSSRADNFATTLTKDFVTTSRQNLRTDLISTETSRILTPSVSEFITTSMSKIDNFVFVKADPQIDDNLGKKRHIDLENKIESFEKIFKRMRSDNLLTESYVEILKKQMPEAEEILKEVLTSE